MNNHKICIVVPIYNHGDQLFKTIKNLTAFDLPIIIVDDGSKAQTKENISIVVNTFDKIIEHKTLSHNMGKGYAVTVGVNIASDLGYTHIFQIDADGQHDFNDIPKFITDMNSHTQALISGMPIYDNSIPKSRLHGRKITNFWVSVEILSMKLTESMCGFRIYPVKEYLEINSIKNFANRMDFDIDVIVRMHWYGVDVRYINTKVIYPHDGYSNFKMVQDNIRITRTHTTLVIGMLLRLPLLVWRKIK